MGGILSGTILYFKYKHRVYIRSKERFSPSMTYNERIALSRERRFERLTLMFAKNRGFGAVALIFG
jgi:hypothetical protein